MQTLRATRRGRSRQRGKWLLAAGFALVAVGAVWAGTPALVEGIAGQAFLVDSAEHEFSFPSRDRFSPGRGTVEFWVQPQREIGVEDFEGVLYRTIDPLSSTQGVQIIFYQRGILVNTKSATGWDVHRVFPVRFAAKSWHHLALTWDGTTGRFYADGAQVGEFSMKPLTDCAARTYLGALAGKYISFSALDEVQVLNAPLSAEEVGRDYQRGRAGQALKEQPGRTMLLLHCDEAPPAKPKPVSLTAWWPVQPDPTGGPSVPQQTTDALGSTDWFQGQWPSDPSMPQPPYPRFSITPVGVRDTGVTIRKLFPLDASTTEPAIKLSLETQQGQVPLYSGGEAGLIASRTGNHLKLVDRSAGLQRSVEVIVISHRMILVRVCVFGKTDCRLRLDTESECLFAQDRGEVQGSLTIASGELGWAGFEFVSGQAKGQVILAAVYDARSRDELRADMGQAKEKAAQFDAVAADLDRPHQLAPFLTGKETPAERNIIAALVNRVLRNARTGGNITAPSMVEFYGPAWPGADGVWICFQPACRYALWIEPSLWANSLRTLLNQQTAEGMVPQAIMQTGGITQTTQIPNISPVLRDYYTFTHDRAFLTSAYPAMKRWYGWLLANRDPAHEGIISVGDAKLNLWESLCEYRDNGTDPTQPSFQDTCNPVTRTAEIGGRPERVFLPDIVACQARMAEDLAYLARELGLDEDAAYFAAEYRRVREWANREMWDEATGFYYPVVRATHQKLMKRSVTAFWLLWAGIPDQRRKDALVAAMFDRKQFFTTIPLPQIALNDPTFNPKCGHWGDGYCWPMDGIGAFDGLLRYGEWKRAAELATQYNRGVFGAIAESLQPNEYYHHSGKVAGCAEMGTAGCLPLVFQRYLRDYNAGRAEAEWRRFAPERMR